MKNTNEISVRCFVLGFYFEFSEDFCVLRGVPLFGICPQGQGG